MQQRRKNWMGLVAAAFAVVALGFAVGPTQAHAEESGEASLDEDLARYWSTRREMPVIAGGKLYPTDGRVEISVYGGILPNDAYFNYFPVGLNLGYHFDSIWGIELNAQYVDIKSDSELTGFLVENGAGISREVDLGDNQVFRADLFATFSPLYGKWSFQTYKISHFDLFFSVGAGVVIVREPEVTDGIPKPEPVTAVHPEGAIGAGFRFFATDWLAIRVDARGFFYPNFESKLSAPAEITLGFSFLTPEL